MDSLFIVLLIGCVIGLEICDFCVFNDEIIVYNDCLEMKYELECKMIVILLSCIIGATTATHHSTINLDSIVIGLYQTSRIGYDSIGVSSPTTIQNENKMQEESDPLLQQTQIQTHRPPDTTFNFVPIVAASRKFEESECIFGVLSSTDEFNWDKNNAFKYWCIQKLSGNYGLYVSFDFDFNFFLVDAMTMHRALFGFVFSCNRIIN